MKQVENFAVVVEVAPFFLLLDQAILSQIHHQDSSIGIFATFVLLALLAVDLGFNLSQQAILEDKKVH